MAKIGHPLWTDGWQIRGKQRAVWVETSPPRDDVEEKEGDGTVLKTRGRGFPSETRQTTWKQTSSNIRLQAGREGGEMVELRMCAQERPFSLHVTSPPMWSFDPASLSRRVSVFLHYYWAPRPVFLLHPPSPSSVAMSDSEDMTEFASIVERIERGEVSLSRMIYGPRDRSGVCVNMRLQDARQVGLHALRGQAGGQPCLFCSILFYSIKCTVQMLERDLLCSINGIVCSSVTRTAFLVRWMSLPLTIF